MPINGRDSWLALTRVQMSSHTIAGEPTSAVLVWIIITACFCGAATEVSSSVAAMTSLIAQEGKLIHHLGKVLDVAVRNGENSTWISRLQRYLDCIESKHRLISQSAESLAHPVVGFRLMRRLIKDWNDVTRLEYSRADTGNVQSLFDNLKSMKEVISQWARWPKPSDIKDAALGLVRIGQTYGLYPRTVCFDHFNITSSRIAGIIFFDKHKTGNVLGLNSEGSFCCGSSCKRRSISDCKHCINGPSGEDDIDNNIYDQSIKWTTGRDSENCCSYGYDILNNEDVLFITNVAINKALKDEASRWYYLLESSPHGCWKKDKSMSWKLETMKTTIEGMKAKTSKKDHVMENYERLCHKSIQEPLHSTTSSPGPLSCSWRYVFAYLRYKVELLHTSPDIYQFHDVISLREMNHIKDLAKSKLSPSTLDTDESKQEKARYWRVSQTAWFPDETPVLRSLSRRVGQLTGLATGLVSATNNQMDTVYSEPLQVVNYGLGGLYGPHLDTLHTESRRSADAQLLTGDRLATWMFYLGDVQVGGATVFPFIDVDVKPIKGSAILWYNLHRNGKTDKRTVHAGCPVVVGDKWVANKWVRETAQWKTRPCLLDPSS